MSSLRAGQALCALALLVGPSAFGQPVVPGAVRGTIVDARGGTPLEKVSVRLQDDGRTAITDGTGLFEISDVPAGVHELYVSGVDYLLVRRSVTVPAGGVAELTIPMVAGFGTYVEEVTVQGQVADRGDEIAVVEQRLASSDLQQLAIVLVSDPIRAVQALPGVANADDFNSEFSVRGLGPSHLNFTFEGVASPLLVHTVQNVRDTGSVAMINADVLADATLESGAYAQRFGNRTGAELDFSLREGSRDHLGGHVSLSVTGVSGVLEGPIGRSHNGSWLFSVRKSYLDAVVKNLSPHQGLVFGFTDAQAKFVYDIAPRHQIQFAVTSGFSGTSFDASEPQFGTDLTDGRNATTLGVLSLRSILSPRATLTQRVAVVANGYRSAFPNVVDTGGSDGLVYRADMSAVPSPRLSVEAGGEVRGSWTRDTRSYPQTYSPDGATVSQRFDRSSTAAGAFAMARVNIGPGTLTPGLRVDHRGLTGNTDLSPWLTMRWPLARTLTFRAGAGLFRQEPTALEVAIAGAQLRPERAYDAEVGVERTLGATSRWQITLYNREDRDVIDVDDNEPKRVGQRAVPTFTGYRNQLSGYSRGVEALVQRRSPNGLSGWLSYSLGFVRVHDVDTGESFWGDFDQRHTFNAYALYRFSDRLSMNARFRYGSNFPVPGYWAELDGEHVLSDQRNTSRVPAYSRLDLRANRTFAFSRKRLTLFVEATNLYDRANVRAVSPFLDYGTLRAFNLFEPLTPLVPAAGLLLEF